MSQRHASLTFTLLFQFPLLTSCNYSTKIKLLFYVFYPKINVPPLGTPILPPFIQEAVPCLSQRHAFLLLIYILRYTILTLFDAPKNILFRKQKSGYVKCTNFSHLSTVLWITKGFTYLTS